jgi:hypothetical protein
MADESRKEKFIENVTAILLAFTTTFGAWSAYHNSLWGGKSNEKFIQSIMTLSNSNTSYLESLSDLSNTKLDEMKDDIFYVEWKNMVAQKDPDSAYYFSRLNPSLQTDILNGTSASTNRYEAEMVEMYKLINEKLAASDSVYTEAIVQMGEGQKAGEHSDDFTLITVLYTIVLFFAGFASLKTSTRLKLIYLSCALVVFIGTTVFFFTLPFSG